LEINPFADGQKEKNLSNNNILKKDLKEIASMAEGIVKWFNEKKGYGFIEQDDGRNLFVHYSNINMSGFKTLSQGDRVSFDVKEGNRGLEAMNVSKL
jgi:CspA family cold shock protein